MKFYLYFSYFLIFLVEIRWRNLHFLSLSNYIKHFRQFWIKLGTFVHNSLFDIIMSYMKIGTVTVIQYLSILSILLREIVHIMPLNIREFCEKRWRKYCAFLNKRERNFTDACAVKVYDILTQRTSRWSLCVAWQSTSLALLFSFSRDARSRTLNRICNKKYTRI